MPALAEIRVILGRVGDRRQIPAPQPPVIGRLARITDADQDDLGDDLVVDQPADDRLQQLVVPVAVGDVQDRVAPLRVRRVRVGHPDGDAVVAPVGGARQHVRLAVVDDLGLTDHRRRPVLAPDGRQQAEEAGRLFAGPRGEGTAVSATVALIKTPGRRDRFVPLSKSFARSLAACWWGTRPSIGQAVAGCEGANASMSGMAMSGQSGQNCLRWKGTISRPGCDRRSRRGRPTTALTRGVESSAWRPTAIRARP